MAEQLPRFIVIRVIEDLTFTNNARYTYESGKGAGFVSCSSGGSVFDPLAKIEVEIARSNSRYAHLKFTHTNKYWGRQGPSATDNWIFATSNQPEEDVSKPSCTLFEPTIQGSGLLTLKHVHSGGPLRLGPPSAERGILVTLGTPPTTFGYMDSDVLLRLPKRVLFKGDNNKYLKAYEYQGFPYLQFGSDDDGDRFVGQEMELLPSGHVRIMSEYFGGLWKCNQNHNWIQANGPRGSTTPDVLFWPLRAPDNTIALRSAQNNQYLKRHSTGGIRDFLRASAPTIDRYARLRLEEPVINREIFNVRYRLMDARVFDEMPVLTGNSSASNPSPTDENSMTIKIGYERRKVSTFSKGISITTGITTEITAGWPSIVEGRIEISQERTTQLVWEDTDDKLSTSEASYTAIVPPLSTVIVDYIATSGRCSVPFSYSQRDLSSTDGQFYTTHHTDGIYTGLDYYSYRFVQR